ncbi:hypothetical protein D3C86_1996530 [compost metagenome]
MQRAASGRLRAREHQRQQFVGEFGRIAELKRHGVFVWGGWFHAGFGHGDGDEG